MFVAVPEAPGLTQTNGVGEPMTMSNHVTTANHVAETRTDASSEVAWDIQSD